MINDHSKQRWLSKMLAYAIEEWHHLLNSNTHKEKNIVVFFYPSD